MLSSALSDDSLRPRRKIWDSVRGQNYLLRRSSKMTHLNKTIQGGKCLMLGALAIAILAAAVQPLAAQVQKNEQRLQAQIEEQPCRS